MRLQFDPNDLSLVAPIWRISYTLIILRPRCEFTALSYATVAEGMKLTEANETTPTQDSH
jgi:hypothetical protein